MIGSVHGHVEFKASCLPNLTVDDTSMRVVLHQNDTQI